ncbi:unnamed protein product [Leptosia nina]|uniref:Enhancer of polycomb-like protein n=1 Tax=Leptosia nina TaxID=320188 RepID=A0AAV1JKQ6_9NEOP
MSKLSFRARALDASKPMPIYLAEELPDLPDYSAINRAVPQMPSGMEKEEESEHHLQRAISGTGLIIPTPEVCQADIEFYERCYPPDYKMPKQHIHMQPLWEEQETPEYDIDSEDERWLKQQRHPELTELKFEQMMDKLEKSSGQTVVTLNEAKLLLERQDDLVIAVYDYWLNKRLTTQHPLILSVKTENRPGQSSNNPYLAFRRRTEKMQTRKNRKNDESSYEKMLKLRRELATALSLLEMVARREKVKRELVKLTALLSEKRYDAKDFTNQLPEPPVRTQLAAVPITSLRRDFVHAFPPRPPSTPTSLDQHHNRQREKRPYKRRKHRHHTPGSVQGVRECTSSEEESVSPIDDGPFAFRRKPGCFYEMPTSTLSGDPVESSSPSKDGLFQHELDERARFTLTSVRNPYPHYVGFARRRVGRGGRVILDRVKTNLDSLWPTLPIPAKENEEDIENQRLRTPKEITRDYHSGGNYPWRHAFRKHLAKNPHLWVDEQADVKADVNDIKINVDDIKIEIDDIKFDVDSKNDVDSLKLESDCVKMDIDSANCETSDVHRTIDSVVRGNLKRVMRKRVWSSSSEYDSDESLHPVEKEFESFISEVQDKWLHFRPKTPPPAPPSTEKQPEDLFPIALDTPLSVELTTGPPSGALNTFTTSEFTLGDLYGDVNPDLDNSGTTDSNEDLLNENFTGLTDDQVESILSETDLKALEDDKKAISDDLLEELVKDSFLSQGQSGHGRAVSGPKRRRGDTFGSSNVQVRAEKEPIYIEKIAPPKIETPVIKQERVPTSKIIVEEVNEVPVKIELNKEIKEEPQPPSLQVKAVKNAPVKKHIITSTHRRPADVTIVTSDATHPQLVTVAVSDSLKQVRLSNQATTSQGTVVGLLQNGPFAVTLPVHSQRDLAATSVSNVVTASSAGKSATVANISNVANIPTIANVSVANPRRVSAPLVNLAPTGLSKPLQIHHPTVVVAPQHHVTPSKLKVLHAHPLTHTQRAQFFSQNRQLAQLPAVVSLATIGDAKPPTLLKAPGSVTQFFEIKSGQLGKGPHLVNVLRHQQPQVKTNVARLDFDKKRQVVFDGTLKGNVTARPQRFSLDGRQIVRTALPVRTPVRHQIQLKNHRVQVATPIRQSEPSTSITIAQTKTASIPSSVMANLIQKNVLPKGQKIAISGPAGQALSANVQAIAFTTAPLKARQGRLIAQPRPAPVADLVEASTAPVPTSSNSANIADTSLSNEGGEAPTNGAVRRRATDTLPMECDPRGQYGVKCDGKQAQPSVKGVAKVANAKCDMKIQQPVYDTRVGHSLVNCDLKIGRNLIKTDPNQQNIKSDLKGQPQKCVKKPHQGVKRDTVQPVALFDTNVGRYMTICDTTANANFLSSDNAVGMYVSIDGNAKPVFRNVILDVGNVLYKNNQTELKFANVYTNINNLKNVGVELNKNVGLSTNKMDTSGTTAVDKQTNQDMNLTNVFVSGRGTTSVTINNTDTKTSETKLQSCVAIEGTDVQLKNTELSDIKIGKTPDDVSKSDIKVDTDVSCDAGNGRSCNANADTNIELDNINVTVTVQDTKTQVNDGNKKEILEEDKNVEDPLPLLIF